MKYILTALVCGLLSLTLAGCQLSSTMDTETSASTASGPETNSPASASIQIQLTRVEQQLTDDNGQVLVEYAYDRPTVTISGNPTAQSTIQGDLDRTIQTQLVDYAKEELLPQAQKMEQEDGTALPLSSQFNLSIQRTDGAVISILTDRLSNSGAHGSDYRSAKNYRTETGEPLTFAMLGDAFRSTATDLVAQQAALHASQLFPDYQDSLSHVILDGTEDGQALYGSDIAVTPTFYLTNDNIVFISREYELQSYDVGILEFPISYSDFGDALDRSYLPNNYLTQAGDSPKPKKKPSGKTDCTGSDFEAQNFLVSSTKVTGNGWTLKLPKEWTGRVYVELDQDTAAFYENGCYSEMGGGWLFSLEAYTDESYVDLPDYALLSIDSGISYVAIYPTDVQFEGASDQNAQRYSAFSSQVESVLQTFALSR